MRRLVSLALALVALLPALALGQIVGPPQESYFSIGPSRAVKVITMTAQGAGVVNSADQNGFGIKTLLCVLNQASHTGTPSTTFTISNKDPASGLYYTAITSAAVLLDNTPNAISTG